MARADARLFNRSSKVVLARDGDTTAITMASDYEGEPKEFALVVPVPTFIERKQIGVVEMTTIDHSTRSRRRAWSSTTTRIRARRR